MSIKQLHNSQRWPPPTTPSPYVFTTFVDFLNENKIVDFLNENKKVMLFFQELSDCGLVYLKDSSNDSKICQCCESTQKRRELNKGLSAQQLHNKQ